MTHGTAADVARRHVAEIINGRRLDLVDELYAPHAVYNDPVAPGFWRRVAPIAKTRFSPALRGRGSSGLPDQVVELSGGRGRRRRSGPCRPGR